MKPLQLDASNKIFQIHPEEQASHFRELVTFILQARNTFHVCGTQTHPTIEQIAQFYLVETSDFPSHLSSLLLENYGSLLLDIRQSLIQNLVMLRNKGVITSIE